MIEMKNVRKKIFDKEVLKRINLIIPPKQITAICGPNGAGKTTIIRIILKLIKNDEGTIEYGCNLNDISFQLHKICLFPELTLKENISFFLKVKGKNLDKDYLNKYLSIFSLKKELNKKVSSFSEGMVKKADLLRVILERPRFLILDEPTSNLDPKSKVDMRNILKELVEYENATVFLTSHLLNEIEKLADKTIILDKGIIKWHGSMVLLEKENIDLESKYIEILTKEVLK
jgi:ABC-2 type transport system ATP-binding protein